MINLIPPEGYRMITREYFLRVGAVFCFLFAVVFVFLGVALVPMYVLVEAQINEVTLEVLREKDASEVIKTADTEVASVKSILAQLKVEGNSFLMSAAIDAIQKNAPEGILFKTFYIDGVQAGGPVIQVQGVATTREKLIQLKTKIEALEMFDTVEVPISDLARDAELPFAITIIPSK